LNRDTRVLGLGDSFTFGQGVRFEDIYLRRLEKLFKQDGLDVAVNIASCFGYDLPQICDVYRIESACRTYPLVIYGLVLSDFLPADRHELVGPDHIDFNNGGYTFRRWRERVASFNFVAQSLEVIRLDWVTRKAYLDSFRGPNADARFQALSN